MLHSFYLIFLAVFAVSLEQAHAELCKTPDNGTGECVSILSCKPLLDLITNKTITNEVKDRLTKSQCSYGKSILPVCCPKKAVTVHARCTTPRGNTGECVGLSSCPHLADLIPKTLSPVNNTYLQLLQCNSPEKYSMCCLSPEEDTTVGQEAVPNIWRPQLTAFPRADYCGFGSVLDIINDNSVIDENPWLVIIEYVNEVGDIKPLCGGALISGKYILTAAHCLTGPILDIAIPFRVRLGEYELYSDPDCVNIQGGADCTFGITTIKIEKNIPHPQYNPEDPNQRHDIALIRLKELIPHTDFIHPVCLPTIDRTQPLNMPDGMFVSGWGFSSESQFISNAKLHKKLDFVSQDNCQKAFSRSGRNITLWKGQLCASGDQNTKDCKGDSGGPLVNNKNDIEIVGIHSFEAVPQRMGVGVYTNVYEYLDWIKSTIVA